MSICTNSWNTQVVPIMKAEKAIEPQWYKNIQLMDFPNAPEVDLFAEKYQIVQQVVIKKLQEHKKMAECQKKETKFSHTKAVVMVSHSIVPKAVPLLCVTVPIDHMYAVPDAHHIKNPTNPIE